MLNGPTTQVWVRGNMLRKNAREPMLSNLRALVDKREAGEKRARSFRIRNEGDELLSSLLDGNVIIEKK